MPASWIKSEPTWKKAKKAVDPKGKGHKYDDPWAVTTAVYKKMGGDIKKKKEKDKNPPAAGSGVQTKWNFYASDNVLARTVPKKVGKSAAPVTKPADGEEEARNIAIQNPKMNANSMLNAIKTSGLEIIKKEADSGSTLAAPLRTKEAMSIKFKCRLIESSAADNGVGYTKFRSVLIQEGLGNLKDAYYYTREALESGVPLFEGKKIYADHPSSFDEQTRPERSVRDIIGHFENVALEETDDGQAQLVADVVTLPDEPYRWARSLMRHSVEFAEKHPDKEFVGLSINADGEAKRSSVEEFLKENTIPESSMVKLRQAMEKGISEIKPVSRLTEAVSCDLVTEAGAGGKILQMLEQEKKKMAKQADEKKETEKKKEADEKKEAGKLPPPGSKADKVEAADDAAAGADAGHDDADDDKALIKKMLKDYVGAEESESEEAMAAAEGYYQAHKEMGKESDEAMKCAGEAMKLAKHMAMKKAEAEKAKEAEEDESEAESEESDESSEKAKEAFMKLKGENARLKESIRKHELQDYLEKKLRESKLPVETTKQFREALGSAKNVAEIDRFWEAFKSGRDAGVAAGRAVIDHSDLFVMTEKNVKESSKSADVDFKSFLK